MNLRELELDPSDFFTLISVSKEIEKAAKPFLCKVVSGEWDSSEALLFLEAVAGVWDHPKGNDWEIARRMAECPSDVARLLLAVAEWREAPPGKWKLWEVLVKSQVTWPLVSETIRHPCPVTVEPDGTFVIPDNSGNDDLHAKDVAERIWARIGTEWSAAGKPKTTAKQIVDAREELRRRTRKVRESWEPVFGVSGKVP